jgi:coproporphyrinogen III oxidase-like Fe-S oxidoreductase
MDHIESLYNTEDTAELSIELNPYPEEEIIQFVKKRIKTYRKYPRVRISFGLQTFDNQILSAT